MSWGYESNNSEFAAAAAAAATAFAIHSLEKASSQYQRKMRRDSETSMVRLKTRKEESSRPPAFGGVPRRFSDREAKRAGRASSAAGEHQKQKEGSASHRSMDAKADAWEKAEIAKIQKRYEKMRSAVLDWENERKMRAKSQMERKKVELEQRKEINLRRYWSKIARIDHIVEEAKAQIEEKRKHEVTLVKEKARKIRSTGEVPVGCFCF